MKHKYYSKPCKRCGCPRWSRIDSSALCRRCGHQTHGEFGTRLYEVYQGMLARCGHKKSAYTQKHNYQHRGITVCDDWLADRQSFFTWARSNGYQQDLMLDRIDNDRGYTPSNCRWVSPAVSAQNRRTTKLNVEKVLDIRWAAANGEKQTSIARRYGINSGSISEIISRKLWANIPAWLG